MLNALGLAQIRRGHPWLHSQSQALELKPIPACYASANHSLADDIIPECNAVNIKEPAEAQKDEEGEGRDVLSLELLVNH